MPEEFESKINRILRDHEGYTGDGHGGEGVLPVGDRTTARKPINKRDLREALISFGDIDGHAIDAMNAAAQAQAALDATTLIAATSGAYRATTISAAIAQGVAALAVGQTFTATADDVDYIGLYRIDAGPVASEVARYPSANRIRAIRSEHLCPVLLAYSSKSAAPNIDIAAQTLTFGVDTLFMDKGVAHKLPSTTVIDLSSEPSSAKTLYLDVSDKTFKLRPWNSGLTLAEAQSFLLVAVIRLIDDMAQMSISCLYRVDGEYAEAGKAQCYLDWAAIIAPLTNVTPFTYFPDYDQSANTLTLFSDTILRYGDHQFIVPVNTAITASASSASRIFWRITDNTFVTKAWDAVISDAEKTTLVQIAAWRDPDTVDPNIPASFSMMCPYTVNGQLFGQPAAMIENRPGDAVEGIHHRGYSAHAPENTLAAYRLSAQSRNYVVEGDLHFSSDGVPVMIHDDTVDRTTDGTGDVVDKTVAELQSLDAGSWKNPKFAGEQIPTFEAVLRLCKKLNLFIFVELKTDLTVPEVQLILSLVRKTGMRGRVEFNHSYNLALARVVAEDSSQRVGLIVSTINLAEISKAEALQTASNKVSFLASHSNLTEALVSDAHASDISVYAWTVNVAQDAIAAAEMGVDGIITDGLNIAQVLRGSEF